MGEAKTQDFTLDAIGAFPFHDRNGASYRAA